jgi:N-acetylmuramoyl-L-alanine amidase
MMICRKNIYVAVLGLLVALILCATTAVAQDTGSAVVKIRAARHGDHIRIVFTAEGFVFAKSSAALDGNKAIVADLRKDIISAEREKRSFRAITGKGAVKEGVPVDIIKSVSLTQKGMIFTITAPDIKDIKSSRLQSPSRMVIDVYFTSAPRDDSGQTAALKPLADHLAFRTFVIDAGHGGYEYGIKGSRFSEKDITLSFSRDLAAVLAKSGRDATLLRKADLVIPLSERIIGANKKNPDIFISIHVSSTKNATVYVVPDRTDESGKAVGRHKKDVSWKVADAIMSNMEKEFSIDARRTELPLTLLIKIKAPAIIIELPNPDEFSYDKKSRERMLSAIIRGLSAGYREDRQAAPAPKQENGPEKKAALKSSKPAVKSEIHPGGKAGKKAETTTDTKAERKTRTRPTENPEGED